MSHFLTLVIIDHTEPNLSKKAEELMMPYFEADEDNPSSQAKCDGFVIGGRYDGIISGKEQHYNLNPEEFQRRYGLDVVQSEDNIRPISTLVPDLVSYAIVTPDGKWHDCQGKSSEEWLQEFRNLLYQHQEKMVAAIDCHC
ncbi:MAG: hypothetical protein KME40_19215 [Komarekiella atlantica HA4396-MV6]|jgi:hypothetical protein|nr:hypothetical protein [Komarekiella atlantica HA4396-MV6]